MKLIIDVSAITFMLLCFIVQLSPVRDKIAATKEYRAALRVLVACSLTYLIYNLVVGARIALPLSVATLCIVVIDIAAMSLLFGRECFLGRLKNPVLAAIVIAAVLVFRNLVFNGSWESSLEMGSKPIIGERMYTAPLHTLSSRKDILVLESIPNEDWAVYVELNQPPEGTKLMFENGSEGVVVSAIRALIDVKITQGAVVLGDSGTSVKTTNGFVVGKVSGINADGTISIVISN